MKTLKVAPARIELFSRTPSFIGVSTFGFQNVDDL